MSNTYWAAETGVKLSSAAYARISQDSNYRVVDDLWGRIRTSVSMYYGVDGQARAHELRITDPGKHVVRVAANLYRYFVTSMLKNVLGMKIGLKAVASEDTYASIESSEIIESVFDNYVKHKGFYEHIDRAALYAAITSEGFLVATFDANAGEEVVVEEKQQVLDSTGAMVEQSVKKLQKKGCVVSRYYSSLDVFKDSAAPVEECQWYTTRDFCNKYDVAALYPEKAEQIKSLSLSSLDPYNLYNIPGFNYTSTGGDFIPVYTLYHRKTPAVPQGVELIFLEGGVSLKEKPLVYKAENFPVTALYFESVINSPARYSFIMDTLGPLTGANRVLSLSMSNAAAAGKVRYQQPLNNNIKEKDFSDSVEMWSYSVDKVEQVPVNIYTDQLMGFFDFLIGLAKTLSGNTDASLGVAEQRLSGEAFKILAAQAQQYFGPATEAYTRASNKHLTNILAIIQDFYTFEEKVEIVGPDKETSVHYFTKDDFSGISSVRLEMTDPSLRTFEDRKQEAMMLLQTGLVKDPSKIAEFRRTGNYDVINKDIRNESKLITWEADQLRQGIEVQAEVTDLHIQHIHGHLDDIMKNPTYRQEGPIKTNTLKHIFDHLMKMNSQDPIDMLLMQVLGQVPQQLNQQMLAIAGASPNAPAQDSQGAIADANQGSAQAAPMPPGPPPQAP